MACRNDSSCAVTASERSRIACRSRLETSQSHSGHLTRIPTEKNGPISFSMVRGAEGLRVRIGEGPRVPPGGIVVAPPVAGSGTATLDGRAVVRDDQEAIVVHSLPASIVVRGPRPSP